MFRFATCFIALSPLLLWATEVLHPVHAPTSFVSAETAAELYDDVYSLDEIVSTEFSPWEPVSIYADASFRFLSYSYEFSTEGYVHNYCNLHVNGFNETYLGAKAFFLDYFGVDLNWRFPPGEGSQRDRFHRLNVEPFAVYNFSEVLRGGLSVRYNTFLEDAHYQPGDEIGIKGSISWNFFWIDYMQTGWQLDAIVQYQQRIFESENRNLQKKYRKMKDTYKGIKAKVELMRHVDFFEHHTAVGVNAEYHTGTIFGFESGYRIGIKMEVPLKEVKRRKS